MPASSSSSVHPASSSPRPPPRSPSETRKSEGRRASSSASSRGRPRRRPTSFSLNLSDCQMDPRRGLCGGCLAAAKWIPVLFISAIVAWSYYAYVVELALLTVDSGVERAVLIILYHFFFGLFVWSYWRTIFTKAGSVPPKFQLTNEEMDSIDGADNHKAALEQLLIRKDLPCAMRSIHQEVRYCSECLVIKPDRAHHCSVCGRCVLKMDHHCPWVNNCVAFNNYKFFVLFLGYALTYCLYVAASTLKYFLQFWSSVSGGGDGGKFHVLFLFFVSAMFSISLASLFFYHLYLVSKNMTTLEAFRAPITRSGPDKMAFHLGKFNNFQEVFGDNRALWFLPLFTSFGDGVVFPQRGQLDEEAGLLDGQSPTNTTETVVSAPGYTSEEHVPMMLCVNEEDEAAAATVRHAQTSSSSEGSNDSSRPNGGAASAVSSRLSVQEQRPNSNAGSRGNSPRRPQQQQQPNGDLVAINM